jgi:hypothetical protein
MYAQPRTDQYLEKILLKNSHPLFRQVIADPETYRLQVIYTRIDRDVMNKPSFANYYFNYDPNLYFNPASIIKLPLALLSLEKIRQLGIKGVDRNTTMVFDSSKPWQKSLLHDTTAASRLASMAHFIKRALLVSENDPYNRMYQFMGQGPINQLLHRKGYTDTRITRMFLGLDAEQNRHTNALRFVDKNGKSLYEQPPAYNAGPFNFSRQIKIGKAHYRNNVLINEPFDFTEHNNISLESMQQILQSVMFPRSVPAEQRFDLDKEDLEFLYRYLSQYPSETPDPKYDEQKFYDSYVKFFFRDSSHRMPGGIRVFNKVGWSYGFLTDISYVADFESRIEYMLSATLYVNSDNILNDNKYDYETIGHPFLFQLGRAIYEHEIMRDRATYPNLDEFKIRYEKRSKNDKRPALKDIDN